MKKAATSIAVFGIALFFGTVQTWGGLPATGGDFVYTNVVDGFIVHAFTNGGTFTNSSQMAVDVLIVGGGGGGGGAAADNYARGGGGGAGGLVFRPGLSIASGEHEIVVGGGGAGTTTGNHTGSLPGEDGEASTAFSLTALGGGGGAVRNHNYRHGRDGGSGGGATESDSSTGNGGIGLQPNHETSGTPYGFGNDGDGHGSTRGGGGAGQAGQGSSGGDGLSQVTIGAMTYSFADLFDTNFGQIVDGEAWFAGGGAGGPATAGKGGGGGGSTLHAAVNTGGGGRGTSPGPGGDGGSGIVMIRYNPDPDRPLILTAAATDVDTAQATLAGRLSSTGTTATAVSVYWGPGQDAGTNVVSWAYTNHFGYHTGDLPADYATNITGLVSGATYTYRYYATNDAGTVWGDAVSFTTWEAPGVPTIDAPTETGFAHVVISGAVTGGNPDPQAWFVLNPGADGGTTSTGNWAFVESAGTQAGAFTNTITGLDADTTYYARVYVTNDVNDAWSDAISFTTLASPAQLTLGSNQQVDGAAPDLTFAEVPDHPLTGDGSDPNWLYDFSYYGASPIPVLLGGYKLASDHGVGSSGQGTITFNLNGGTLSGDDGLAIETFRGNENNSSRVVMANVGAIAMGGIDTHAFDPRAWYDRCRAGSITIGSSVSRAGSVRVEYLHAYGEGDQYARGASVTVYSSGDVRIEDSTGQVGDIRADSIMGSGLDVTVDHDGHLSARTINADTHGSRVNTPRPGHVTLNGGSALGNLSVETLTSRWTGSKGWDNTSSRSTVTIRNYNHLTIGSILRHYSGTERRGLGSHVDIHDNIRGDITISGEINLRSAERYSDSGYLRLVCGGTITLGELDLDKVLHARLDSGSGETMITGAIRDFATEGATQAGTKEDPKAATVPETRLRAPLGQIVYYNDAAGVNDDLGGDVWQLRNLANNGSGGLLVPASDKPATGTVIRFR